MLLDAQLSPVVAWSYQLHSCQLSRACPPPQSEWDCLKLAGGRARTALGALTQAATSPPFPESGSRLSFLSAGKPASGQGPEDGPQICRVTLTLPPAPWDWHSLPRPLLPGPRGSVLAPPYLGTSLPMPLASPEGGHQRKDQHRSLRYRKVGQDGIDFDPEP